MSTSAPESSQCLGHVDRFSRRLLALGAVVLAESVQSGSPLHPHSQLGHVAELHCVVGFRPDGLAQIQSDLGSVHVEGGHGLDVVDVVAPEHYVHQARNMVVGLSVGVVIQALHQRTGAVANTGDGDADGIAHSGCPPWAYLGIESELIIGHSVLVVGWPVLVGDQAVEPEPSRVPGAPGPSGTESAHRGRWIAQDRGGPWLAG